MNSETIYKRLLELFPNASCELNYKNDYQLIVAVVLSAQTTDIAVNKVTDVLFKKYPNVYSLAIANTKDVEKIIKPIGLYKNKTKNIINLSKAIVEQFAGVVPNTYKELITLDGVGRKTANVVLSELFNVPAIAIDTHVNRVSKRLGLVKKDASIIEVERKLQETFKKEYWSKLHHLLIHFGRYKCLARNPKCENCPFIEICVEKKLKKV
ncbi:MAG: endonuclease III [Erysipelotrichia bacterium]|nr:endonuclease III [Erysipelotrichia bacterium]